MLYASSDRAQKQMHSLGHYFNPHATLENKLGLAGASYELASSIPRAAEYVDAVAGGWAAVAEHETTLQSLLLEYLNGRDDVTVHGSRIPDAAVRVPTVSFTVRGWDSGELVRTVGEPWAFRWGAFYSNRLVGEVLGLGDDGVVRVSLVHYNTGESSLCGKGWNEGCWCGVVLLVEVIFANIAVMQLRR